MRDAYLPCYPSPMLLQPSAGFKSSIHVCTLIHAINVTNEMKSVYLHLRRPGIDSRYRQVEIHLRLVSLHPAPRPLSSWVKWRLARPCSGSTVQSPHCDRQFLETTGVAIDAA